MKPKKREIYTRLDRIREIIETLERIRSNEEQLRKLFAMYDKLDLNENSIFDNWKNYFDDTLLKLEHITL